MLSGNVAPKGNVKNPKKKISKIRLQGLNVYVTVQKQNISENRQERSIIDKDYHWIRRAAEEVEDNHARRRVEEMHHGIRLIEETLKVAEFMSEANAEQSTETKNDEA